MPGKPCKYGERVNGKCPTRKCKSGPRVRGKCPCKYGERVNGKCPPKRSTRRKKTTQKKRSSPTTIDVRVVVYEDGEISDFINMSGNQQSSVENKLLHMLNVSPSDIKEDEDENIIVKNVPLVNGRLANKYHLNEKISVEFEQYSVDEWGETEIRFVRVK